VLKGDIPEMLKSIAGEKNLEDIAGDHEFHESEHLVVPKLALFTAIAEHCDFMRVNFQNCIGSCAGVMITDTFWQKKYRTKDLHTIGNHDNSRSQEELRNAGAMGFLQMHLNSEGGDTIAIFGNMLLKLVFDSWHMEAHRNKKKGARRPA
jgi:hypothetical protein